MSDSKPELHTRLVLAAAVAVFLAHAAWLACIAEDSYISFRFAANLVAGHGLVWNPGEAPVEGFTNLLWVLLTALVDVLGLPVPRTMQLGGVLCGVATLALADRVARVHLGLAGWGRAFPVCLLALSGPVATWAASGLETPLFALLVLATLDAFAVWQRHGRTSSAAWGVAFAALATLTRPDGVLVMGSVVLFALASPGPWRRRLWPFAAYAGFLALLTLWRQLTFGAPLPNTFYAKTGGGWLQAVRGATYAGYFAFHYLLPVLLFLAAAWQRTRDPVTGPWPGRILARLATRPMPAALAAYALLHTVYVVVVGGDYMAMYRFFVPVLAPLYLLAGIGCDRLVSVSQSFAPLRPAFATLLLLAGGLTVVHSTPLEADLYEQATRQHGTWRGVETERWHVARLRLISRFFADRAAGRDDADASVATGAIGVIGYDSGLVVYDFNGLVDPVIARRTDFDEPLGTGLPGHEKSDPTRILERRPTFWMHSRWLRDKPGGWPDYDKETDAALRREYRRINVWLEDVVNDDAGYFTYLERRSDR